MTDRQKAVVEDTFMAVAPIAETAAMLFYKRLFETAPGLKPLFRSSMEEQGRKLMQTLSLAVSSLNRIETLEAPLLRLGARHAGYGVKDKDYGTVADALLWTLHHALGERFDQFARDAWIALFQHVAGVMQKGAAECINASPTHA
jgi:hemoglobin-like flavoprotein